jgi:hypothetical protein
MKKDLFDGHFMVCLQYPLFVSVCLSFIVICAECRTHK